MAATPYKPTSWSDATVSKEKLQQMSNNDQWLFENTPRMRYTQAGIVKDNGIKIICGKAPFAATPGDGTESTVYFGSFFSAACKPIVTVTTETTGGWQRKFAVIRNLGTVGSGDVDYRGFVIHMTTHERAVASNIEAPGWLHWIAIGY